MATDEEVAAALELLPPEAAAAARRARARGLPLLPEAPTQAAQPQPPRSPSTGAGDVWGTALRAAAYWDRRCALFGERHAFAPLEEYFAPVPPAGAADDPERLATLRVHRSGVLASPGCDAAGRSVVWFDPARIPAPAEPGPAAAARHRDRLLRVLFHHCHAHADDREVVGAALIDARGTTGAGGPHWTPTAPQPALDLLRCFPVRFHAVHICVLVDPPDRGAVIARVMKTFRAVNQQLPFQLHFEAAGALRQALLAAELTPETIPRSLGGLWENRAATEASAIDEGFGHTPVADATSRKLPAVAAVRRDCPGPAKSPNFAAAPGLVPSASLPLAAPAPTLFPVAPVSASYSAYAQSPYAVRVNPAALVLDDGHVVETTMMQQEGIRRLDEAMEMLPLEVKAAHQAAMRRAPYLVSQESNPIHFLRFEKYNAWAAAQKLATYWMKRVQIFGDRAFLPLTLNENGALLPEDIEQIRSGYFTFLPKDIYGRTVLCYDPTRRKNHSRASRMRVGYYIWTVICENDLSITQGFVALVMLGRSRFNPLDNTIKECADVVVDAFPTFPQSFHLVNSPSGLGQRIFFDILLPLAVRFMSRLMNEQRTAIHVGEKEELVAKLGQAGLLWQSLPDYVGGSWAFESHHEWIRERLELEYERYSSYIPMQTHVSVSLNSGTKKQSEVHGPEATAADIQLVDNDRILERYENPMHQAINTLPGQMKAEYLSSLQCAPEIVKKESDMAAFLRYSRFDVEKAASRLTTYWKARSELFGDRATLPLQQTGEGALDRKDITVISSAYLACLPNDIAGRSVVFCDGSRLSKSSRQSRLRSAFYMYSIAAENEVSQREGIILLYVLTEASFDRANKECLQLVIDSLPVSIRDVHLLQHRDENDNSSSSHKIDQDLLNYLQAVVSNQVYHHSAPARSSLAHCLNPYGLRLTGLPKSIGGKYGLDNFVQWQELRTRYEWDLPAGVSSKEEEAYFDFSAVKRLADLSSEEKNDRKRKLNVIHSRRKRERERIEVEVLEEQFLELKEEKSTLLREEMRLCELIQKALTYVPKDNSR